MKATFAPLPARAIGGSRLTGIHFRVLAAICLHDRMSTGRGKGQGCWASHQTLASECGCHYTSLSSTLTQLGAWGYLERNPHPLNKRLRVYTVIYSDADAPQPKPTDSLPTDKLSGPAAEAAIVCPVSENTVPGQGHTHRNIFRRNGERDYVKRKKFS